MSSRIWSVSVWVKRDQLLLANRSVIVILLIGILSHLPTSFASDERVLAQLGTGDSRVRSLTIGAETNWMSWETTRLELRGEIEGAWWFAQAARSGDRRSFAQFELTPSLRHWLGTSENNWFVEAGIGLAFISPLFKAGDRRFSTTFNFADHVGLGRRFQDGNELSLHVEHFSNGGIKHPNPGIDFVQLRLTRRF